MAHISVTGLLSKVRNRGNSYLWRSVKSVCGISKLFWEQEQQNPGTEKGQDIILFSSCPARTAVFSQQK